MKQKLIVKIAVKVVIHDEHDFEYIRETLEKCREAGSAEIIEMKVEDKE